MSQELPPQGTRVTAKRIGWNESLTEEQAEDQDPYEHESDDLEGPLEWREVPESGEMPSFRIVLVGGQEADADTVKPLQEKQK